MTKVYNLENPDLVWIYSLPPDEAVIAAYEQQTKKNYNTYNYKKPNNHEQYLKTKYGHVCGDFYSKETTRLSEFIKKIKL